jgi:ribosomal protein L11 methyltransferase
VIVMVVVATPGGVVVHSDIEDESEAERLAADLRGQGLIALVRPDDGPRLDAWVEHTRPVTFGGRLEVRFAWSEHPRGDEPLVVELGLGGFGNGNHQTTRLLVEELIRRVRCGESVLDVGCGSGVLGLCALRLGAERVVAVDIKPDAVEATQRNAALNGMDDRLEARRTPLADIDDAFDIVLANIGRAAVVELAPDLVRLVSPGGWLAVSGISPPQCDLVTDYLRPLVETERRTNGEWAAVILARDGSTVAPWQSSSSLDSA